MKLKKMLAGFMTLCMMATSVPVTALADDAVAKIGEATYTSLASALEAAEKMTGDVTITLTGDVEWETGSGHGTTPLIGKDSGVESVTIDGQEEYTLTATGAGVGSLRAANGRKLVFNNLTIDDKSVSYAEDSWEFTYLEFAGNLEFNNCDILSGISLDTDNGQAEGVNAKFVDCAFESKEESVYCVWIGHGDVTFEDCSFTGTRGAKIHEAYGSEVDSVIFDDCAFEKLTKKPGLAIGDLNENTEVTIKDCVFDGVKAGDQGKFIYESDTDISEFDFNLESNTVLVENAVAEIDGFQYASLQDALNAAAAGSGEVTVEILKDIDLTNVDWNPVTVSAPGYPKVTVEGNNKTITGLNDMLFAGTWAGDSGLVIKDLTIADSNIEHDKDDEKENVGVGAFIGYPSASAVVILENCHLIHSTVEGGHWTGGLIGTSGGYGGNDGPVFMNLTIKDCSVKDSEIKGNGSVGAIIGHGALDVWTLVEIEDCTVTGNTITSNDDSTVKAGVVMGTIGAAGSEHTTNDITKTGGVFVDVTESDNVVTSNGVEAKTVYGRQGTSTGVLTITGGNATVYTEDIGKFVVIAEGLTVTENLVAEKTSTVSEPAPAPSTSSGKKSSKKYSVDIEDAEDGTVKASSTRVKKDATVTLTVTPDEGYELDDLVVLDKDGEKVKLKDKGNGKYTFTMPRGGVEVEASFVEEEDEKEPVTTEKEFIKLTIGQKIVWIFDEYVVNDVAPEIKNDRTMLPIRVIAEALGAKVTWNEVEQKVTIAEDDLTIEIFIGQPFATVNGAPVELDAPAYIANDRTYLPLRFVAENLGATVEWNAADSTVTIYK